MLSPITFFAAKHTALFSSSRQEIAVIIFPCGEQICTKENLKIIIDTPLTRRTRAVTLQQKGIGGSRQVKLKIKTYHHDNKRNHIRFSLLIACSKKRQKQENGLGIDASMTKEYV